MRAPFLGTERFRWRREKDSNPGGLANHGFQDLARLGSGGVEARWNSGTPITATRSAVLGQHWPPEWQQIGSTGGARALVLNGPDDATRLAFWPYPALRSPGLPHLNVERWLV